MVCDAHKHTPKDCENCLINDVAGVLARLKKTPPEHPTPDDVAAYRKRFGYLPKPRSQNVGAILKTLERDINLQLASLRSDALDLLAIDDGSAPMAAGTPVGRQTFRNRLGAMGTWVGIDELEYACQFFNVSLKIMARSGDHWFAISCGAGHDLSAGAPTYALTFSGDHYEVDSFTVTPVAGVYHRRPLQPNRTVTNGQGDCGLEAFMILYDMRTPRNYLALTPTYSTGTPSNPSPREIARRFQRARNRHNGAPAPAGAPAKRLTPMDNADRDYISAIQGLRNAIANAMTDAAVDRAIRADNGPPAAQAISVHKVSAPTAAAQYGAHPNDVCPCGKEKHTYSKHRMAVLTDSAETIAAVEALHARESKVDVTRLNKTRNEKAERELVKQAQKGRNVDIRGRSLRAARARTNLPDFEMGPRMLGAICARTDQGREIRYAAASGPLAKDSTGALTVSLFHLTGTEVLVKGTKYPVADVHPELINLYGREFERDLDESGSPIPFSQCAAMKLMTLVRRELRFKERVETISLTETDWTSRTQLFVGGKSATQRYVIGELSPNIDRVYSCDQCRRYLSRYLCDRQ